MLKNCLISLLLILLLLSCASQEEGSQEEISNKDFSFETKYDYDSGRDLFELRIKDNRDVLLSETLERLNKSQLRKYYQADKPLTMGLALCHQGDFERAFKLFDKHYRKFKGTPPYWNIIGVCYFKKKEFAKAKVYFLTALEFYRQATKSKNYYLPALNNLGVFYARRGEKDKAVDTFRQVLKEGESASARFNLAQIYLEYGLAVQANKNFYHLYKRNSQDVDVVAGLAFANLLMGSAKISLDFYNQIPKEFNKFPHIGLGRVVAMIQNGQLRSAIKLFVNVRKPDEKHFVRYHQQLWQYIKGEQARLKREKEERKKRAVKESKKKKK